MSAEREQMLAALAAIDPALEQLAVSLSFFRDAMQSVSRTVYHEEGEGEVFALEQQIGIARLLDLIVRRMRTLGLQPLLDQARTSGTLDETVSATLEPKIERLLS